MELLEGARADHAAAVWLDDEVVVVAPAPPLPPPSRTGERLRPGGGEVLADLRIPDTLVDRRQVVLLDGSEPNERAFER